MLIKVVMSGQFNAQVRDSNSKLFLFYEPVRCLVTACTINTYLQLNRKIRGLPCSYVTW